MGDYKLIIGPQHGKCDENMLSPLDYPCSDALAVLVVKTVIHTVCARSQ